MANPKLSSKRRKEIILLAALAAVIVSIFLVQFYITPENSNVSNICSGTLDVSPGEYTYKAIQIATGKIPEFIAGWFSTSSNGTVRALIFNETYFQLFQNTSLALSPLYDSGLVSSGRFNVTLVPLQDD